jgi:hypothetical protein
MATPRASEARLAGELFGATAVWSGMALPFQFATVLRHLISRRPLSPFTKMPAKHRRHKAAVDL